MVARQDATLNLSRLLSHAPGVDPEVHEEGLLAPSEEQLRADGIRLAEPLAWEITVRSTGGDDDYIVEGEVSGTAVLECRRCLADVETPVTSTFFYPMVYRPAREGGLELLEHGTGDPELDVDDEILAFPRPEVDFAPLLRQVFAIDLPLTALCREDCRGLSPEGVNLNEHPEEAPEQERPASPFAQLEDLDLDDPES